MFVPLWLFFLTTGTLMAVLALAWAWHSRQFDDQDRARYLALQGLSAAQLADVAPPRRLAGRVAVLVILLAGSLVLAATALVVLRNLG
jgi:hypothetical protein